jgi:hypothetical protein
VRDAFAVQDALSLGLELTRARASASLDPRLRPTLDDLAGAAVCLVGAGVIMCARG